jgi:salicylate hydroxylase
MVSHRLSLAAPLYEGCKREKSFSFHFSIAAETIHAFSPKPSFCFIVKPRHSEPFQVECDLLATDGVKSVIRAQMLAALKHNASVVDTGQAAYRITVN